MPSFANLIAEFRDLAEWYYYAGRINDAIRFLEGGVLACEPTDISNTEMVDLLLAYGRLLTTNIFMNNGDVALPFGVLERARHLASSERQQADVLDLIGFAHYYTQLGQTEKDFSEARAYLQRAWDIREGLSDNRARSESLFHLGLVSQFSGEREVARDFFARSYELAGDHIYEKSFAVRHLGFLAEGEQALAYLAESLQLRESIGLTIYLPFSHQSMGNAYMSLDDQASAESHFQTAYNLALALGNRRAMTLASLSLGMLRQEQDQTDLARHYYQQAIALAKAIDHQVALKAAQDGLEALS